MASVKKTAIQLTDYQMRWVQDKYQFKMGLWARQTGKSFGSSLEAVDDALETGDLWILLSRGERQSKQLIEKVQMHCQAYNVAARLLETDYVGDAVYRMLEVRLPNRGKIIGLPANPDTARGFSGNVLLDEFAFHQDSRKIWAALFPTITRGYKIRVISTANGKQNMFYDLWTQENRFSGHKYKTTIYDAKEQGLNVDIDALREGINDPDAWAQEYECQFIDEATAFLTYDLIASCEDEEATIDDGRWTKDDRRKSELYVGVDIGRKRDLTVIWVWEKLGDVLWTRMVKRLEKATFKAQREVLFSILDGSYFNPPSSPLKLRGESGGVFVRRCCIDATGLGMQLAEEAITRFGSRAEAVTFTNAVKEDLAVTLRRKFEDRLVRIPPDRWIREDFHSVKKYVTAAGNVRFDSERTEQGHSDHFWAAALGAHAAAETGPAVSVSSEATREDYHAERPLRLLGEFGIIRAGLSKIIGKYRS